VKQQQLANAELAVMNLLWQNDLLTARQIREKLYPDAAKAQHGTVQRLLQRLEDKGYVERDRSLSVHLFSAAGLQIDGGLVRAADYASRRGKKDHPQ